MDNQEGANNKQVQEKGRRLTKKQSLIILVAAMLLTVIGRKIDSPIVGTIGELSTVFALLSLLTKNGLRWK